MRVKIAVAVMVALLGIYLVFAVRFGLLLVGLGEPVAIGMGIALLALPLLGVWALVVELRFAVRAERLGVRLGDEGGLPAEELPLLPSGRVDRAAAAEVFPAYQKATEAAPEDWRTWYRLGLAYDAAGDRRRARWATQQAIRLARD
ncbi:tetratricopeptide repeat protein [Pseudolysinimonas sp.]